MNKGILERMKYVHRVRRLVKIVYEETNNIEISDESHSYASLNHCLLEFKNLNKKYTNEIARATLAIATGKHYLAIENVLVGARTTQKLAISSDGIILLTPTGYINALSDAVAKIAPIISIIISVIALIASFIAYKSVK